MDGWWEKGRLALRSEEGRADDGGFWELDTGGGCWGLYRYLGRGEALLITNDNCMGPSMDDPVVVSLLADVDEEGDIGSADWVDSWEYYSDPEQEDDPHSVAVYVAEQVGLLIDAHKRGDVRSVKGLGGDEGHEDLDDNEVEAWRRELEGAADNASSYFPSRTEVNMLLPVIADLEPEPREWLRRYLKQTIDEMEESELEDEPGGLGDDFVRRVYFKLLEEQIDFASDPEILDYRAVTYGEDRSGR
jgi:hypothetical protein